MIKYFLLFAWAIDLIVLTVGFIILFCYLELLRDEIRRLREILEGTKMTNLEAADLLDNLIGMVSDNHDSDYDEALSKGRDILKSESCEDCISRKRLKECFHRNVVGAEAFDTIIDMQPSIQPKTGHWIKIEPYPMMEHEYKCSECYNGTDNPFEKYCSECGAKMQEVEE